MKVYAFIDGKRLVGSAKKPPYPLATINVKPRGNTVVAAFDKLAEPGILAWNERRNRWISNEESKAYGKYLRRCYR